MPVTCADSLGGDDHCHYNHNHMSTTWIWLVMGWPMPTDPQVGHFHPTWGSRGNANVADFLQASPIHDDHYSYFIRQAYKCKT